MGVCGREVVIDKKREAEEGLTSFDNIKRLKACS